MKSIFDIDRFGWKIVKLKDISTLNPKKPQNIHIGDDTCVTFVPMEAVDSIRGNIERPITKRYGEVSKGYTFFMEGDILFAKITPCMQNGKHAIARNLIKGLGFASTEFHVIRPNNKIMPEWVHLFLRQKEVLDAATKYFTGAVGQQRVPITFLSELQLPIPEYSEQKRIVSILNEQIAAIEKARKAAEAQLKEVETLPNAYLNKIFNSSEVKSNFQNDWKLVKLVDICDSIKYGYTASADFSITNVRLLRITDIQNNIVEWEKVPGCKITEKQKMEYFLENNDILFARTGATTGKSYLIKNPTNIIFASYLIRIRPSQQKVNPDYLFAFFQSADYWNQIQMKMRGGAQPNLNATLLSSLKIPLTSLSEQKHIVSIFKEQMVAIEKARKASEEQLATINLLPGSLLQKAFNGEL